MTTWFVSRHAGAIVWAARQGIAVDRQIDHLDPQQVASGDTVIGTLPIDLAAAVCARGARYQHLVLRVPRQLRGAELSADQLEQLGARLEPYLVQHLER
ncbi:CRISPR-associated protein Csx16 [Candidatus Accumulibacter sp. ACC003]|uniref:CRISPR-associated protein Csx16 n=1 Tax=Candidatus Accumulibacter sp. ACC003 TaxID=2823334 RepID=UPI0025BCED4B|nr:CRISPR-associated protein Csx16 [Candidatus Accumulibacter sp. ACC003]